MEIICYLTSTIHAKVLVRELGIGRAARSIQNFAKRVDDAVGPVSGSTAQFALVRTCFKKKTEIKLSVTIISSGHEVPMLNGVQLGT